MTEILTSTGIFLDLSPDTEFEVTIENPMLGDDRVIEPWSTDIGFPPTATNKRAFGWIDALLLEPSVREIGATIIVYGIHLWTGTLVYDGISDGKANYTFTSRDYSAEWSKKLYQLPFLGDEYYGLEYMQRVLAGTVDGVKAPLVVNRALVASHGFVGESWNSNRKYRNAVDCGEPSDGFIPAVTVLKILSQALGERLDIGDGLKGLFGCLAVFGTMWSKFLPATKSGTYSLNVFDSFPDVGLNDFIEAICRMSCSAVYSYRGRQCLIGFEEVAASSDVAVWDDRVSDDFEVSGIDGQGYSLSLGDSSGTSIAGTDSVEYKVDDLSSVAGQASRDEYRTVRHSRSGDVYSVKKLSSYLNSIVLKDVEWITDRLGGRDAYETAGEDIYDSKVDLKPAVCAPIKFSDQPFDTKAPYYTGMAPIIDIPGIEDSRPTSACIALLGHGQATDNGYVMTMEDGAASGKGYGEDVDLGYRLEPEWLFEHYHKSFAEWLARRRSAIKVDVDLSVYELAALKIWTKVSIHGRLYVISKISVRMTARVSGTLTVSCELIAF